MTAQQLREGRVIQGVEDGLQAESLAHKARVRIGELEGQRDELVHRAATLLLLLDRTRLRPETQGAYDALDAIIRKAEGAR